MLIFVLSAPSLRSCVRCSLSLTFSSILLICCFRSSLLSKVEVLQQTLRSDFSIFEKLRPSSPDFASTAKSLKQQILAINVDVADLSQTIAIVENNRDKFPTISDEELDSRRTFVTQTKQELQALIDVLKKAKDKQANANRQQLMENQSSSRNSSKFSEAAEKQNRNQHDEYINNERQAHTQMVAQQDEVLGDMSVALSRLQVMSQDINTELVEQGEMINDLDGDLDSAQLNMNVVMKKLDKLLKTSDKGRICCIFILVGIAILLFFLIIYA